MKLVSAAKLLGWQLTDTGMKLFDTELPLFSKHTTGGTLIKLRMKKIIKICSLLCLALMPLCTHAQRINGICINSNQDKIVVVVNGQPLCEDTHSCFIAHLNPGTYEIQVYRANEMHRKSARRQLLFDDRIRYSGHGVRTIQIAGNNYDEDESFWPSHIHVMDKRDFKDYLQSIKDANFDDQRIDRIDMLPKETSFTSEQCGLLSKALNFDSNRVTLLKKLYPRVVDKVYFYKAIDTMDFLSNQKSVKDFVEKFNRRH